MPVSTTSETLHCLALGLRDGLRPRIALASIFAAAAFITLWLTVFIVWRGTVWAWAQAAAGWMLPAFASALGAVLAALLVVVAFATLVVLCIRLYEELFLMSRIQRHCLVAYPQLGLGVKGSWAADLRSFASQLLALGLGLPLLLLPLIGGLLYLFLASYLNVRGLVDDALDGVATPQEREQVIRASRLPMLGIGLATTAMLLIPFVGFLMPGVLGASTCHLCLRSVNRVRGVPGVQQARKPAAALRTTTSGT